jgi:MraZ protein
MFEGEFLHKIDKKGRLILPAQHRDELESRYVENFHITIGIDECLRIYPDPEWKKVIEDMSKLPQSDSKTRYVIRMFISNASPSQIDKQGRIFVPSNLREKAGITRDVIVVGMISLIEVWSKEKWEKYKKTFDSKPLEDYTQQLFDKGIMK